MKCDRSGCRRCRRVLWRVLYFLPPFVMLARARVRPFRLFALFARNARPSDRPPVRGSVYYFPCENCIANHIFSPSVDAYDIFNVQTMKA